MENWIASRPALDEFKVPETLRDVTSTTSPSGPTPMARGLPRTIGEYIQLQGAAGIQ